MTSQPTINKVKDFCVCPLFLKEMDDVDEEEGAVSQLLVGRKRIPSRRDEIAARKNGCLFILDLYATPHELSNSQQAALRTSLVAISGRNFAEILIVTQNYHSSFLANVMLPIGLLARAQDTASRRAELHSAPIVRWLKRSLKEQKVATGPYSSW